MKTETAAGSDRQGAPRSPLKLPESMQLGDRLAMIRLISNRLFLGLVALLALSVLGAWLAFTKDVLQQGATTWLVMTSGIVGGFISLQRRLKEFGEEDLKLLAGSWIYVLLSPLVGGLLAMLLYVIFLSDLVTGELFPTFVSDGKDREGIELLFYVKSDNLGDYAKLVVWCFVAGFSEKFVTNIVSHFETTSSTQISGSVNARQHPEATEREPNQ